MKKLLAVLLMLSMVLTAIPALSEQGEEWYSFLNYRNRLGNEATLETLESADANAPAAIATKYNIDTTTYERSDLLENFPKDTCWVYRSANIYAGQASARNNSSFLVFAEQHFEGEDDVRIGAVRIELYGLKYAFVVTELKNRVAGLLGVGCEVKIIE